MRPPETNLTREKMDLHVHGKIPRIIWTFWNSPELPPLVQYCISTWKRHNPSYTIRILNMDNYKQFIRYDINAIKHAHDTLARFSDYMRLALLADHGGIWMDATTICNAPLDWVNAWQYGTRAEFVGYRLDETLEAKSPIVESWFLAAVQKSWFMNAWKEEFYRTRFYDSVNDYLADVEAMGVDVKGIPLPDYLMIHISAQVVLQRSLLVDDMIHTFNAVDSALKYLNDYDWNTGKAVEALQSHKYDAYPIIKMRSHEAKVFDLNKVS